MRAVYVAGPLTKGDVLRNIHDALAVGSAVRDAGFAPFLPHLCAFWEIAYPASYERWMAIDFEMLRRMDCLLRIPGESAGADREVAFAQEHGIPVFHGIGALLEAREDEWAGGFRLMAGGAEAHFRAPPEE
jgi:hypothetical protein